VIVAVIIVQDGKLLMTQEAKQTCYEKWYIPAGKVEVGENPFDGAIRECFEETGLELEPKSVFCIEYKACNGKNLKHDWVRYGVTGNIIGGSLKIKPDVESLQAKWVALEEINKMELRNDDFLHLLKMYNQGQNISLLNSIKQQESGS